MFDNWDKSTMIALLKVYETLYENDEHEILYVLIIKSKFSDHFIKNVLLPYYKKVCPAADHTRAEFWEIGYLGLVWTKKHEENETLPLEN